MGSSLKMLVGLGNPGPEYENTRHNAGFMVLDALPRQAGRIGDEEHRYTSTLLKWRYAGRNLLLVKPLTYMNLSGRAVARIMRVHDFLPDEIMVVYDCMDLPLGRIRFRLSGSSGGHKGMESIIQALGTNAVPRLRVGIGRRQSTDSIEHVLSPWQPAEKELFGRVLSLTTEALLYAIRTTVADAMNRYNALLPGVDHGSDDGNGGDSKESGQSGD